MAQVFLLSSIPMTLDQGRDHLHRYQDNEYSSIYHRARFEPNLFINVQMRTNVNLKKKKKILFTAVSKASAVSLDSVSLTQK